MSNDTKKDIDTIIKEKLSNIPVTSDIVKKYLKGEYKSLMGLAATVEIRSPENTIYKKSTTSANNPLTKFFTNNTDSVEKCIEKFEESLFSDSILCKEPESYVVWSESYFAYPFSTNVMLIKHSGESESHFTNEAKYLNNIESPFTAIFTNGPFRMIVRTAISNKEYDGLKENFKSIVTSNFRELTIYGSDCECEAINELKIKLNKNVKFINNHEIIGLKELCVRVTSIFVSSIKKINIKETIEALNQIFELPLSSEDVSIHGERILNAIKFLIAQPDEEGLIFATNFLRTIGYKRSFSLWDLLETDSEKDLEMVISTSSEAERTFIRAAIGLFKK
jgi:hypothetical protein